MCTGSASKASERKACVLEAEFLNTCTGSKASDHVYWEQGFQAGILRVRLPNMRIGSTASGYEACVLAVRLPNMGTGSGVFEDVY